MKDEELRWSRHLWFWGFLFLFLSHAFAVFWLGDRRNIAPSWQQPGAFLYFSGSPDTDRAVAEYTAFRDPTLFAIPHPQNFSGGAWLNFRREVPKLSNWMAPPEWLPIPAEQLGKSLDEYVATNRPSEEPLLASLRARSAPEVRIPDEPVLTGSTVKVEGAVASRKLVFVPVLADVPHNDVLPKTVIAIAVNEEGIVESASVVKEARESGLKWVDDHALRLARNFAFAPLAFAKVGAPTTMQPAFGRLVFTWNTVPSSNQVSANVSPP